MRQPLETGAIRVPEPETETLRTQNGSVRVFGIKMFLLSFIFFNSFRRSRGSKSQPDRSNPEIVSGALSRGA